MTTLTRRYHFSASHRLHSPELSDAENESLYGKCNNPFGHGHNYVLEVTAAGEIDDTTGLICPLGTLDRLVREKVLNIFSHRNVNRDLPSFARLVPTTENIALVVVDLLRTDWEPYLGSRVKLHRVHIQETDRNGFEVFAANAPGSRVQPGKHA